ncbi:MAG: FmdB family zinc ribbon protein [Nitrososphaerales archaeon]
MPTYVYECEDCGVRFERLQSYSDAPLRECPECSGHVHRVIQPVGVIFKGSGFYVTDNKGKSSTGMPAPKKEDGATAPAADKKTESASAASSAPASESSPAKKTD